jgi:hypothetical protein
MPGGLAHRERGLARYANPLTLNQFQKSELATASHAATSSKLEHAEACWPHAFIVIDVPTSNANTRETAQEGRFVRRYARQLAAPRPIVGCRAGSLIRQIPYFI